MKDAPGKWTHGRSTESAVIQERCSDAVTSAERNLAEILAGVLSVDDLSADSHF